MHDTPVFEPDLGQSATHLCPQLNLVHCGKLAQELKS